MAITKNNVTYHAKKLINNSIYGTINLQKNKYQKMLTTDYDIKYIATALNSLTNDEYDFIKRTGDDSLVEVSFETKTFYLNYQRLRLKYRHLFHQDEKQSLIYFRDFITETFFTKIDNSWVIRLQPGQGTGIPVVFI